MLAVRRSDASEPFHRALDFYHWPQWRDTAGESRKVFSERLKNWVGKRYERCNLKLSSGPCLLLCGRLDDLSVFATRANGNTESDLRSSRCIRRCPLMRAGVTLILLILWECGYDFGSHLPKAHRPLGAALTGGFS